MTPAGTAGPALPLPDPPLVDAELSLRPWQAADAPALAAAWVDPEIVRWTGVPPVHDEAAALRWIEGEGLRRQRGLALDLVLVVDDEVVGEVGLSGFDSATHEADVGWWVAEGRRGSGLATRAVRLVADWALAELCTEHLVATCDPANPASGAVARRCGFTGPLPGPDGAEVWRTG